MRQESRHFLQISTDEVQQKNTKLKLILTKSDVSEISRSERFYLVRGKNVLNFFYLILSLKILLTTFVFPFCQRMKSILIILDMIRSWTCMNHICSLKGCVLMVGERYIFFDFFINPSHVKSKIVKKLCSYWFTLWVVWISRSWNFKDLSLH